MLLAFVGSLAATDWTPTILGTSATWYDAADNATVCSDTAGTIPAAANGTVGSWKDKSGRASPINLTQNTAGQRPVYQFTGLNGKRALYFNSANNCMLAGLAPMANASELNLFLVHQEVTRKTNIAWRLSSNFDVKAHLPWVDGNVYFDLAGNNGVSRISAVDPIATGTAAQWLFRNSMIGNSKSIIYNANTLVDGSTATTALVDVIKVGSDGSDYADCLFSEIILLSQDLPLTTRQRVEGYLAWKWGSGSARLALAAGHPYFDAAPSDNARTNASAPAVTGNVTPGSAWNCSTGTWSAGDGDGLTYFYQWYRSPNPDGSGSSTIAAATNSTYTVTNADVGYVACQVTARNTYSLASTATPNYCLGSSATAMSNWRLCGGPLLSGLESTTLVYPRQAPATPVSTLVVAANLAGSTLTSATVAITTNYNATDDILEFVPAFGITSTYSAGTLTLSGTTTAANYTLALQSVTFRNTNATPPNSVRTLSLRVFDGALGSPTVTRGVALSSSNAPSVLAPDSGNLTYTETYPPELSPMPIASTLTIADSDSLWLAAATVTISGNFQVNEDVLRCPVVGKITWNYAAGVLTMTGPDTLVNFQTMLQAVTYYNSNNRLSTADRTVEIRVNDGYSWSNVATRTISLVAKHFPPAWTGLPVATSPQTLVTINEVVSCTDGVWNWPETATAGTLTRQWYRAPGKDGTGKQAIAGETGPTYPLAAADAINFIACEVTANDGTADPSNQTSVFSNWLGMVGGENHAPVAYPHKYNVAPGGTVTGTLTASDRDGIRTAPFVPIYQLSSYPSRGTLQLINAKTGDFVYIAPANVLVGDVFAFAFTAYDGGTVTGGATSAPATITITVVAGEPAPVQPDSSSGGKCGLGSGVSLVGGGTLLLGLAWLLRAGVRRGRQTSLLLLLALICGGAMTQVFGATTPLIYNFDDGTLNGWHNRVWDLSANNNAGGWVDIAANLQTLPTTINGGVIAPASANNNLFGNTGARVQPVGGQNDYHLNTLWLRSPVFFLDGTGDLTVNMACGKAYGPAPANENSVSHVAIPCSSGPPATVSTGWKGVALRTVSGGVFVLAKPRLAQGDGETPVTFSQAELAPYIGVGGCTLELINSESNEWGWLIMDTVSIPGSVTPPAMALTTTAATNPTNVGVTFGGAVTNSGGSPIITRGVCWSTTPGITTLPATKTVINGAGIGSFTSTITTGLNPGTTYYYCAYATNGTLTTLGNELYFTSAAGPTLSGIETTTLLYSTPTVAAQITSTMVADRVPGGNLTGATVQITGAGTYQTGFDRLDYVKIANIDGAWDGTTLTLTGIDTPANYTRALRAVTYRNLPNDPNAGNRTVTFRVSDVNYSSTSVSRVIAVNHAPVLANIETTALAYAEHAVATNITATLTTTDVDVLSSTASGSVASATVRITGNYQSGADELSFINTGSIVGVWNASTGTLTLTGASSQANYETALHSVRFANASYNPSVLDRTVSFTINDGGLNSNVLTRIISVTLVNDPPVNTAPPVVTGFANVGSLLTATSDGAWTEPEGESMTFAHQWCSSPNQVSANAIAISGQTGPTYTVTQADTLRYIAYRVTVTDNASPPNSREAWSPWRGPVHGANQAPTADSKSWTVAPGGKVTGTLTGADRDGDLMTFTLRNLPTRGSLLLVSQTLGDFIYDAPDDATVGEIFTFTFTASDGQVNSALATGTITVLGGEVASSADNGSSSSKCGLGSGVSLVGGGALLLALAKLLRADYRRRRHAP